LSFVLAYAIGPALGSQLIRLEDRCPRDSASGAAQPGLYRLDVGPRVSMQVRKNFRVHFDYRQRLAGLPRSGPAITLAADF
jgi:hypothetical protein